MTTQIELARKGLMEVLENLHTPSGYIGACQWIVEHGQLVADALAGEWRTIESAPKDGTWILVFDPNGIDESFEVRPVTAQWTDDLNGRKTEWHWQFAWFDGGHYGECEPTHWMPLPPAPPREKELSDE